jgi:hypothetical protein
MVPLTLLAAQKVSGLLTNSNALQQTVANLASACGVTVPSISSAQVVMSSVSADLGDMNLQLAYPRICIYSSAVKNTQIEKFRSFSGSVTITAEVFASGNLISDIDQWIHFYVEGVTQILRQNIGDWGDGMFFPGTYDVQLQATKTGGLGFVESAKVSCIINVSLN